VGRLFLKLYSIIAVASLIFFIGVANLETIVHGTLESHYGNLSQGSYILLEKRLEEIPESQWPELIDELNQGGGYPIEILPIKSLDFSSSKTQRLNQGKVVLSTFYEAVYNYKRLLNSEWVLVVPFEQSGYEDGQRLINSTFNLIEKSFREHPENNWPAVLENLNLQFWFPIALIDQFEEEVLRSESDRLENRKVVIDEHEEGDEFFYRRIDNSTKIIKLGPFDEPITLNYIQTFMMLAFSILVALAVLIWVYPLWRDLKTLDHSTSAFGQGDFTERASTGKHSVLHRLASSFNAMADRIQGLISSHQELTNSVSHELRTPIARLRFGMEMLQDSTGEDDRNRFIEGMNSDIDELDQLVAELLTYARFDRDKPEIEFQRQEIYPWLNDVIRQSKIGKEQLTIDFEIQGQNLKHARFDPLLMTRALGNLLQNAKRYAQSEIKVVVSNDNGYFQLSVDDDGPGIPEQQREQIFDAFKRLDASRDRGTGGFGLGLSITQRICQWHGGEIAVEDSPLGGARFVVRWPEQSTDNLNSQ
jgi:signal transduction histidine kinase